MWLLELGGDLHDHTLTVRWIGSNTPNITIGIPNVGALLGKSNDSITSKRRRAMYSIPLA